MIRQSAAEAESTIQESQQGTSHQGRLFYCVLRRAGYKWHDAKAKAT
eukprot:IDg4354t1